MPWRRFDGPETFECRNRLHFKRLRNHAAHAPLIACCKKSTRDQNGQPRRVRIADHGVLQKSMLMVREADPTR